MHNSKSVTFAISFLFGAFLTYGYVTKKDISYLQTTVNDLKELTSAQTETIVETRLSLLQHRAEIELLKKKLKTMGVLSSL